MPIKRLDHVNLRTARLAEMVDFYREVLGLVAGDRPPFAFPGAWLYCGSDPVIHLVGIEAPLSPKDPSLEHFAFEAEGLEDFLQTLKAAGIPFDARQVPGAGTVQVNLHDPDGNHLHVDFPAGEALPARSARGMESTAKT